MARTRPIDDESGTAALEFALVLPVLLMLYLGMVQLTALLSAKHRLSSSAAVMADLVTRHRDVIWKKDLDDYLKAAELIVRDTAAGALRTRVFVYRPNAVGAVPKPVWQYENRVAPADCTPPRPADLQDLTATRSDIVVVVTCAEFTFPLPQIAGFTLSARPTVTLRQQAIMRPRTYLQINCRDCPSL